MISYLKIFKIALIVALLSTANFSYAQQKTKAYPALGEAKIVLEGEAGKWDENNVHTFSIIEANKDGYKYWGYYGVDRYCEPPELRKCGLIRSNDLINWERYSVNPIIDDNCRWPTAVISKGETHLFYAEYNSDCDSRIVHVSSKDGIHFGEKEEIVPMEKGKQNQNPFIFQNPKDKKYYLYYYHGRERGDSTDNLWEIYVKSAKDIKGLQNAKAKKIMSERFTIAAPSVAYYKGKFYLLIEAYKPPKWEGKWVTIAYESNSPDKGFKELSNNPLLKDDDACAFQYIIGKDMYITYSHRVDIAANKWLLKMVKVK